MVEGLTPEKFKQAVMVKLQHESGWKADPYQVMQVVVTEAKEWKKIEMYIQSSASSPKSPRNRGSKSAGRDGKPACHRCDQVGHFEKDCPASSGGEPGQSSAAHHSNRRNKGKGRGNKGGGGGGSSGGGGSQSGSQSGSQQQQQKQQQKQGSGSASAAAGSASAPQRAVQVGQTATVPSIESAPVAAPAQAPAAMPAATPGETSGATSAGTPPTSSSAGWRSYPPALPFGPVGTTSLADPAQPWRQLGIAANRPTDQVPVELGERYVPAELFFPNQRERGVIEVRAV